MPLHLTVDETAACDLDDVIAEIEEVGFDPRDIENFHPLAPSLKRLSNNRSFLTELICQELEVRCHDETEKVDQDPQVILLHRTANYLIRANIWTSEHDEIRRHSDPSSFVYGVPHDHNFSFLTAGHFGPGYWSDYYEPDQPPAIGHIEEPIDLKFIERSQLELGKMMLYRAFTDIHVQIPPELTSISLNIVGVFPEMTQRNQYLIDVEAAQVLGFVTQVATPSLLRVAGLCGGENAQGVLRDFAESHPLDRTRFAALKALSLRETDLDGMIEVLQQGTKQPRAFVREMSKYELRRLESTREGLVAGRAA